MDKWFFAPVILPTHHHDKNPVGGIFPVVGVFVFAVCIVLLSAAMSTIGAPSNAIEGYCTFTLAPDVTAGGLPSQEEIAKDLESTDDTVSPLEMTVSAASPGGTIVLPLLNWVDDFFDMCRINQLSNSIFTVFSAFSGQEACAQGCHYGHAVG